MPQPIAHIHAWKRRRALMIKELWNVGVSQREICDQLQTSEDVVDRIVRGQACRDVGPATAPRKAYGRNGKARLRELVEVPG